MRTCVLFLVCPLPRVLCFLPRLTVLLPALPDVQLSAPREVHVQPPVRLPLGDRGHIRLRDTPHKTRVTSETHASSSVHAPHIRVITLNLMDTSMLSMHRFTKRQASNSHGSLADHVT